MFSRAAVSVGRFLCALAGLLVLLAGCTTASPPLPEPPMSSPAPMAKPVPPVTRPAAATVVRQFDAAKARESPVVLGPDITKEQIEAIRAADVQARQALTRLGRLLPHPGKRAMNEERQAVRALKEALDR